MSSRSFWESRLEMNTEKFHKSLSKLVEISRKGAKEVTLEAARKFAAAARQAMPPSPGKSKIAPEKLYRKIIEIQPDEKNSYLRMSYYHRGIRYRVPWIKTLDHGRSRGVKEFSSLAEAQKFSAIKYRGASRYGWAQGIKALGGRIPNQYSRGFPAAAAAARLIPLTGSTVQRETLEGYSIEIENHSRAAGDYWLLRSEAEGRKKAANAMNREIRKIEKEMQSNAG
ncbi:MAG: hypothetical protein IJZ19_13870 [Lentisphaeria bacterium]|nr:hypothetical protein [Lentisphaeria bacterium]